MNLCLELILALIEYFLETSTLIFHQTEKFKFYAKTKAPGNYLVFINTHRKVTETGVFDLGLSDHSLVYCVFKSGRPRVAPKTIEYRSYKNYNKQSFIEDLENVPWHVFNNTENVDDCVNTWNKLFLDVVEAHAPTKTRRVRGSSVPWMTSTTQIK